MMKRLAMASLTLAVGCGFLDDPKPRADGGSGGSASTTTTSVVATTTGGLEPFPPGGAGGNAATVVTWNLETFPLFATTVEQAAEVIDALGPDVLALQEITDEAAWAELLAALPDYEGILNEDPEGYLRLGLVTRRDRVTVTDVTTLFVDDEYRFPRPPLFAHVEVQGDTAIDFDVVVLHQKAQVDPTSRDRRRQGIVALEAWLAERLTTSEEQDVMILGDLNDELLDPVETNVFSAFLDRPAEYAFLTLPVEEAGDYSYIPFTAMIDHVLITADMQSEVGDGETEVLRLDQSVESYGAISDHRPVRSWLRW